MTDDSSDPLLTANAGYAAGYDPGASARPARRLAVLTCMDARIDVLPALGLRPGDAHVLRNAGGVVTDDAVRSLVISQRLLGTTTVAVVQHTACGLLSVTDEEFAATLRAEVGSEPPWTALAFTDLEENVRASVERLRAERFLAHTDDVRGYVFDVQTGLLRSVG